MEELWNALEHEVPYSGLRELFGPADPVHVDYACLEELLKMLERAPYPVDAHPLPKPGSDKLEFNELGAAYRREIREGWSGLRLMDGYLASRAATDPEFGERLAQRFRERYYALRSRPALTPDDIYENLRLEAGWKASPEVKREMAVRVILAYFLIAATSSRTRPYRHDCAHKAHPGKPLPDLRPRWLLVRHGRLPAE